ncbi:MAG: hypothetical protein LBJ45_00880, partial [Holosporaceae bacterium]|nr:hypothetical protein [Holosporaceae bacterium]
MILLGVAIPVFLLGVKYAVERVRYNREALVQRKNGDKSVYKECAREAALAVAQNWNPGLSLDSQKDAALKVADAVYNAHPCYYNSPVGIAIPGLSSPDPNDSAADQHSPSMKIVEYIAKPKYLLRHSRGKISSSLVVWNPYVALWRSVDGASNPENYSCIFDEIDSEKAKNAEFVLIHSAIHAKPLVQYGYMTASYPTNACYSNNASAATFFVSVLGTSSSYSPSASYFGAGASNSGSSAEATLEYQRRYSGANYVALALENDRIRVNTDKDVSYAVPAECNLDLVLAIPVNGAANNANNRDAASDTAGTPYYADATSDIPADAQKTPLYQMGQACKNFVKDNFYHTRGVNMALIPYSAKVSLAPDKAVSYTAAIPAFQSNTFTLKSLYGCMTYATLGEKDANLTQPLVVTAPVSGESLPTGNTPYVWGGVLTGSPIMSRNGTIMTEANYGNNRWSQGNLLSSANPNTEALKYRRMNLNPCYLGYANLLSMKCERACTTFLPNPYHMIELTANLQKIYELCNALYPIYDAHN